MCRVKHGKVAELRARRERKDSARERYQEHVGAVPAEVGAPAEWCRQASCSWSG